MKSFLFVVILLLFAGLYSLEYFYYDNFLFSNYRIQPQWLMYATGLVLILWATKLNKGVLGLILLFVFGFHLTPVLGQSIFRSLPNSESPTQQLIDKHGEVINFLTFVRQTAQGKILLPPETEPWHYTGNSQFVRALVYPLSVETYSSRSFWDNLRSFDYILVSSEASVGKGQLWPNFSVPATEFIVFNWDTHTGFSYSITEFRPEEWENQKPWGLIKVRKE